VLGGLWRRMAFARGVSTFLTVATAVGSALLDLSSSSQQQSPWRDFEEKWDAVRQYSP